MTLGISDSAFDERDLPDFYCPACTSLRFAGEPSCATCSRERPDGGWRSLSESPDPHLGRVVDGRFVVTKREAAGAHATVYRAQTVESGQVVALKVARLRNRDGLGRDRLRERMAREVRAVRMLENRHILSIHEFVELEEGPAAIVMDYVAGRTAEHCVERRGPLEVDRAVEVASQVASGLATAHRSDLLHRDLKPSNVMLEEDDAEDGLHAYVTDFGIVRMQAATSLTQGFIGTPLYASPEQVRMEELDPRTDVYSLGATLYYLLTGAPPFPHESTMDVMRAQLEAPIPSVSRVRPAGDVPSEVEETVRAMLAKDRSERPADAQVALERLEAMHAHSSAGSGGRAAVRRKPDTTVPGVRFPAERGDGDGAEHRPREGDEESGANASGAFTPVGTSTSEFAPLPNQTGEVPLSSSDAPENTRTGLQPLASRGELERSSDSGSGDSGGSPTEDPQRSSPEHTAPVVCATDSGERFLAIDERGRSWLFDSERSYRPRLLADHAGTPVDAALSQSAAWVALDSGSVERLDWDGETSHRVLSLDVGIAGIGTTADGTLAVVDDGGTMHWRRAGASWESRGREADVSAVAAASHETTFAVAEPSGGVEIHPVGPSDSGIERLEFSGAVEALALGAYGALVAGLVRDGTVAVRHVATGHLVASLDSNADGVDLVYFTGDGELYAVIRKERRVTIRDLRTGLVLDQFVAETSVRRRS